MLCSCGRPHATLLAERQDADQLAVDDLSAQARELPPGPQRDLILAKVKELKAEVRAERQMALALKLAKREMVRQPAQRA